MKNNVIFEEEEQTPPGNGEISNSSVTPKAGAGNRAPYTSIRKRKKGDFSDVAESTLP